MKQLERIHPVEAVFVVVTFGFMLEEFAASKEHGWTGMSLFFHSVRQSGGTDDDSVYSANVGQLL